jgi:hypothetical protein
MAACARSEYQVDIDREIRIMERNRLKQQKKQYCIEWKRQYYLTHRAEVEERVKQYRGGSRDDDRQNQENHHKRKRDYII